MFTSTEEVLFVVVGGTILFVFLIAVVVVALVRYQNRRLQYLEETNALRDQLQREVFEARLEVQEQTSQRISREIHDNIGQLLSLVSINLGALRKAESAKVRDDVEYARSLLTQAIADLRSLSRTLSTEYVTRQSLEDLLANTLESVERSGCDTSLSVEGNSQPLESQQTLIAFRIAQEAIVNAVKHARGEQADAALSIDVTLAFKPQRLALRIADDGVGIDLSDDSDHNGLLNMRQRAKLIDAKLAISAPAEGGTLVELDLPLS